MFCPPGIRSFFPADFFKNRQRIYPLVASRLLERTIPETLAHLILALDGRTIFPSALSQTRDGWVPRKARLESVVDSILWAPLLFYAPTPKVLFTGQWIRGPHDWYLLLGTRYEFQKIRACPLMQFGRVVGWTCPDCFSAS